MDNLPSTRVWMKNKSTHGIDVINVIRKFLVIIAFAFWMGGFTFYAGVVVEVGSRVLESHHRQGMVTQQVTHWLNLSGVIALGIFLWNILASRTKIERKLMLIMASTWAVMVFTLLLLFVVHRLLDAAIYREDVEAFDTLHAVYLVTSTVQWVAALAHILVFTQVAFTRTDKNASTP